MESLSKIIFLFFLSLNIDFIAAEDNLVTVLEDKFQNKLCEYTNYFIKCLEKFNDNHLGNSEIGKMLGYNVLKPKFGRSTTRDGKNLKKLSVGLIPLIFHIGAASTWMMLTGIMAVKSVVIGLTLLVFKIAVSSAKVGSFFTALKAKHGDHHHDSGWAPHYEHHGNYRSISDSGTYFPAPWNSYYPDTHDMYPPAYKTIPSHGHHDEDRSFKDKNKEIGSNS